MRSIRFSSSTGTAWKIFQRFPSLITSFLFMEETNWSKKSWLMISIHWPQMQTMQKIGLMIISATHTKLFWMSWQTKWANCSLCMAVVEPTKHLFGQRLCPIYKGKVKSCLQLSHQELHLCCFWAAESPIQDSRFWLICTMSQLATSHNKWKWLS